MEQIRKYFPNLSEEQELQLSKLKDLYSEWNSKINVISRKDIDNIYEHHVLHSLAIAKLFRFKAGTEILDLGTGGGFPGVPLAIMFPECNFKLIDGTQKKILVVNNVISALGLKNCTAEHIRGEEEKGMFDFVVSRGVMPLADIVKCVRKNVVKGGVNSLPNGFICLKGGNLDEEVKAYRKIVEITPLKDLFDEEWFAEKHIVYLPF